MDIMIIFKIAFIILGIAGLTFVFSIITSSNPKVRAKTMEKQMKAVKYMMDENEDVLKEMATQSAEISSEGIEIKARAMKKGFENEEEMFCKHCGKTIDKNSKFCKYCGKEQ